MIEFIPTVCYECGEKLKVTLGKNSKYKLMCVNTECGGIAVRKFQKGMLAFEIAGIGPAIFKKIYDAGVRNISDLLTVTPQKLIESGEFKSGRALDKLMESIKSIKSVRLSAIIESLQFENVGSTISKEIEKYYCGLPYNFTGFDYSIRNQIEDKNSDMMVEIKRVVDTLSSIPNIEIIFPKEDTKTNNDLTMEIRIMEMTGSPKDFGFVTKGDFVDAVSPYGIIAGTLNKDCHFLVTDDLSSKTSKMAKAEKLGVQIVTYGQLFDMVKSGS
jgi:NAD-dependent DNA ligase